MKNLIVTFANPLCTKKETARYMVEMLFSHDGLDFAVCKQAKPYTGIIALLTKDHKHALYVSHHDFEPSFAQERMKKAFTTKQPVLDFLKEKCLAARNEKARILTERLLLEYA